MSRRRLRRPTEPVAWLGRGDALLVLKRYDEFIVGYDRALALNANLVEAWLGRGNALIALQRYDEALAAFDKALALKPEFAEAWNGRGNVFCELKRYDDALAAYDRALALKEDLKEAWLGRGHVFCDLDRYAEGFTPTIERWLSPLILAEAYHGKALIKLSLGEFAEGWPLYERRTRTRRLWQMTAADAAVASLGISANVTREQIADKNIAVIAEQGVGDEIMFPSTLDDLLRDTKSVTYQLDPRLIEIFSRAFPQVNFVSRNEPGHILEGSFDIRIRAGSLPYVCRRTAHRFHAKPICRPSRISSKAGGLSWARANLRSGFPGAGAPQ